MTQEDRNRAKRKLRSAARIAARHLPAHLPPVMFLTDPVRTPDPVSVVVRLSSPCSVVYRHYGDPCREEVASKLALVCRKRHLTLLIANDPGLAMAVGADGVHWPFAQRAEARKWRTRFALMTVSAHSPDQLRSLQDTGFDAALLSTVFPSSSPSARAPIGATRFRPLARASRLPAYALGGVNADTAAQVAPVAGISGIEGIEEAFRPRT